MTMAMQFGRNLLRRYFPTSGRALMPVAIHGIRKFSNGVQSRPKIKSPINHILPPLPVVWLITGILFAKPFLDPERKLMKKESEISRVWAEARRLEDERWRLRKENLALMDELYAERRSLGQ